MSSPTNNQQTTPFVYAKGDSIPFEEDLTHEYKGHRNFAAEEIPLEAVTNKTRKPISRNLCGFLNTGCGGIVYCGVQDNGIVESGIPLTDYQKDHILLSLQDLFSRFNPPVPSECYTTRFVPVVQYASHIPTIGLLSFDDEQRNAPHTMRKSIYCWCDKDASSRQELGKLAQSYIIEVEIFPWDFKSTLSVTEKTPIHPLFSNEEGLFFIRRFAGTWQLTLQEVIELAEAETIRYHTKISAP